MQSYKSSLEGLTSCSKSAINKLTTMADKDRDIAEKLVELVEERIVKVCGICALYYACARAAHMHMWTCASSNAHLQWSLVTLKSEQ